MAEVRVPNFDITSFQGRFAPAGTLKDITVKLNTEQRKVVGLPRKWRRWASTNIHAIP
jgi:hypothetical protein